LCNTGPASYTSGNAVYLTGLLSLPLGFNGEIAVLPAQARPSHYLYMIAYNDGPGTSGPDQYVTLRIDPDGSIWIFSPQASGPDHDRSRRSPGDRELRCPACINDGRQIRTHTPETGEA
jgi:hypothetical protein